jgi:hypothetical protein
LVSVTALPVEVASPVKLAFVVTVPAVSPDAVPVILVATKVLGVPRLGVVNIGLIDITNVVPVPVWLAMPVALPTEVMGPVRLAFVVTLPAVSPEAVPVMLVPTNADGVPRSGVTRVGLMDNTTDPVPVLVFTPVPPLATFRIPDRVIAPLVADEGVSPVAPPENVVTTPPPVPNSAHAPA